MNVLLLAQVWKVEGLDGSPRSYKRADWPGMSLKA